MVKNVLIKIAYDGTLFHGWQRQPQKRTVQGTLEETLSYVLSEDIKIEGSGRTDAGVHALGQMATFQTKSGIPVSKIPLAVNHALAGGRTPVGSKISDAMILDAEEVPMDFHARFSAKGKTYRYVADFGKVDIFKRNYRYFFDAKSNIDISEIKRAADILKGEHDFSAFRNADDEERSPNKKIFDLQIKNEGSTIIFEVSGDGFLYNMVRIIAGTLIEVGVGRRKAEDVKTALATGDRSLAGHTAPACGLYLKEVYY